MNNASKDLIFSPWKRDAYGMIQVFKYPKNFSDVNHFKVFESQSDLGTGHDGLHMRPRRRNTDIARGSSHTESSAT